MVPSLDVMIVTAKNKGNTVHLPKQFDVLPSKMI